MSSGWTSRFDCCTFAGFLAVNGASCVIGAMDDGGELRLANCTFARNDGVDADVRIASKNSAMRFYALNCIFGDGFGKAYSVYLADGVRTEIAQAVDAACKTLSSVLTQLQNAESGVWGDTAKLAKLREAQDLVAACRGKLQAFLTGGGFGRGGRVSGRHQSLRERRVRRQCRPKGRRRLRQ